MNATDYKKRELAAIYTVINVFSAMRPHSYGEYNINWRDVPPPDGVIESVRDQLGKITDFPPHYSQYFNCFSRIFDTPECDEWRYRQLALWKEQRVVYESKDN